MTGLSPGGRLGKYDIGAVLGKGAMGTVYGGVDPVIDRRVAIKTARRPDAGDVEAQEILVRFKREAQAAGRLHHPNIVGVFDYGETTDLAYIVMEFVEGRTLKDIMDAGERLPLAETLQIMQEILAGLAYSHARGVVHRDIKPANIMLVDRDNRVKITDFGIARIESSSLTQAGTVLGTPAYMSPEQFMGQTVDGRTDIYSSGVLMYQLLTGERPFDGGLTAIMHKVLHATPPRPSDLSVTAPPALDDVVARAMARRPEDRFADAESFANAIRDAYGNHRLADATILAPTPLVATPPASPSLPHRPGKRAMAAMLGGGAAALVVGLGVVAWLRHPSALPQQPPSQSTASNGVLPALTMPGQSITVPGAHPVSLPEPVETQLPSVKPPSAKPGSVTGAALAGQLATLRCTLARASVSDSGVLSVNGLAGKGEPEASLQRAVASVERSNPPLNIVTFDGPYCDVLDVLRPMVEPPMVEPPMVEPNVAGPFPMQMALAGGVQVLHEHAVIALDVALPAFAGHLQVDYFQHDGTVTHLVPDDFYPGRMYAAGSRAEFGQPRPGFVGWKVGPPFGTDMVTAIVTTAPLFPQGRADGEKVEIYLRDLKLALDSLRRQGGSLAAEALVLDTRP